MKKQMPVGLVVEGNVTGSQVLRLACLRDELGPVKSVGLQVARRVSNFMRAGFAVAKYQDLECAPLVLLRAPDLQIPRIVAELCESALPFGDMSFVLCESWLSSDCLIPLRRKGAQVGCLLSVGPLSHHRFVLEGDSAAVRRSKRLLSQCDARVVEIRPGTKSLLFAANLLCTAIAVPPFQLAQQALRESGMSGNDLAIVINEWSELLHDRTSKGARGTWGGPLAECSEATAAGHFRQLATDNPEFAAILQDWLNLARRQKKKRTKSQTA